MDKASVVAIRDALLNGEENRTIRIAFDNGINLSLASDTVFWDDDKELVIAFTADNDSGSFSAGLPIEIICSTYENIQFIMGNTKASELGKAIDGLKSIINISDEKKEEIVKWYTRLGDYRYELSHKNYNPVDIVRD